MATRKKKPVRDAKGRFKKAGSKPSKAKKKKRVKKPSRTTLELAGQWRDYFTELVSSATSYIRSLGINASYRTHLNADGSVDAAVLIDPIPNGDLDGLILDIEESMVFPPSEDYFIALGVTVQGALKGSPTLDKKPSRAWTYFHFAENAPNAWMTMRKDISANLEGYMGKRSKFRQFTIRLHWNPENNAPKRPNR